ncbi:sugar nucleotide-binding protein [Bacteriovorax sp. Seq25_V]|uniref:sugar nucleotide-binding protein n=1 Tax=Bacteriovorax sp. Seq25_V TaxID=1201288 RepID=UPI00038A0BCB|nr:sugar nucleotide-binding protein [Bacteriovorax sp. Seq25_V]EQC43557.1 substrate binding domain protein [Bacteriovorax sp. Seq25_V]
MSENTVVRRKTVLIFGISSFVGSSLAEFFKKDYRVVGTYNDTPVTIPGVMTIPCSVLSKEEVQLIMFSTRPDITIYAAGMSSIVDCALEEGRADALNTSGLFNVVEYCQRYKSQIIYISSNFVFAGEDKSYLEMDIPDPNTVYGRTQASAEFYIQKTSLNYLVFRSCKLYGRNISPRKSGWFEKLQDYTHFRKQMTVDDYVSVGFLDVSYLGMIIKMCVDKGIQNRLFQISSADKMTHYEFAKTYTKVFGETDHNITKGKWSYPVMATAHAAAASSDNKLHFKLDVTNAEGFLNLKFPTIEESLEFTFRRLKGVKKENKKSDQGQGITFI